MDTKLPFVLSALLLACILVSASDSLWLQRSLQSKYAPWLSNSVQKEAHKERLSAAIIRIPKIEPRKTRPRFMAQHREDFRGRWTVPDDRKWVGEVLEVSQGHYLLTRKALGGLRVQSSSGYAREKPVVVPLKKNGTVEGYRVMRLLEDDLLGYFGVQKNDVLTHVNGISLVKNPFAIHKSIVDTPKDAWIQVTLRREKTVKQMHYKLGEP